MPIFITWNLHNSVWVLERCSRYIESHTGRRIEETYKRKVHKYNIQRAAVIFYILSLRLWINSTPAQGGRVSMKTPSLIHHVLKRARLTKTNNSEVERPNACVWCFVMFVTQRPAWFWAVDWSTREECSKCWARAGELIDVVGTQCLNRVQSSATSSSKRK